MGNKYQEGQPIEKQTERMGIQRRMRFQLIKLYNEIGLMITQFKKTMQGIKRKRRCQNQCDQHIFGLKNLKNNSKYDITLSFCPKYQRQPLPLQHTFAEYNNDGVFYTSAFVLGVDKKAIAKNLQKELLDHQKLIKQNCEKYNQIVFPRPNSKHTTCSVCKQTYKNYYQHIFSDQHSQKIQLSPYNIFLQELCSLFQDQWQGCAEKADQDAFNRQDRENHSPDVRPSDDLNLDHIVEEQDIQSNPSRISKYLEDDSQSESDVKEVVMRRPVRVYEPAQYQKPAKVYEDRQARKKSINFAAFFDDEPKKKIINDHRDAVNAPLRKSTKTPSLTETKSKQKVTQKRQLDLQDQDPFIIEYNARTKRKEKKSYYYLKKKQREERQQRERELVEKQQMEKGTKSRPMHEQEPYQIQSGNEYANQKDIQQSSEREYEKYLDDFHQNAEKTQEKPEFKKTLSMDLKLFEEVQKKPYIAPLFESFANPVKTQEKNNFQKPLPSTRESRYLPAENSMFSSQVFPVKRTLEKELGIQSKDKKMGLNNEQKQQILDKNRINYQGQNYLPLFHKFRNPLQKEAPKQNQTKTQKGSQEVFNEYQQKIRQYHKQKDYNGKFKQGQKINPFQEKIPNQISHELDSTLTKINKPYLSKDFQETYRYGSERSIAEMVNSGAEIKTEAYNSSKYGTFTQGYYKKPGAEKDGPGHMPLGPMLPQTPYSNPHQFYPSYNYPISPYGYPMHDPNKVQRPPLKYGEQRQAEPYERGYYYGGWQAPYYMPNPPGAIAPPQAAEIEGNHKGIGGQGLSGSKIEAKGGLYPGYPSGYAPGYPPVGYPGYYPPPGVPYAANQRQQYSHPNPNMRLPNQAPPTNTSININFPMYMGSPYHSPYQYQGNPQRYAGQQPQGSQYMGQNQGQSKSAPGQYGYGARDQGSLPPYAEYQEYKKREGDRRR